MFRHLLKKNAIIPIILFFLFPLQIWGIDGTGMTFQIGIKKTLYKNLGIYLSEDIRPTRNFKEMGWFLFTAELNYKITPHLKVGAAYMNLARSGQADQLRNRYYIYVSGNYSFGELSISLRERFQGTYRAKKEGNPTNYLRSMLKVSYNAGRFIPFAYIEPFNRAGSNHRFHTDKIRFSAGTDIKITGQHYLQIYYRYHIFNGVYDPINYQNSFALCYFFHF